MVAADARTALMFSLSAGQAHDAPEGRKLLNRLGPQRENLSIVMDRAYEGNEDTPTRIGAGIHSRRSAVLDTGLPMDVRHGDVQETQRS